jgi:hypothetical protein|nr:MAG TPA_asm: hypothetical protein [Caudoviricetes sp.]
MKKIINIILLLTIVVNTKVYFEDYNIQSFFNEKNSQIDIEFFHKFNVLFSKNSIDFFID